MSLRLATFNIENLLTRFDFTGFRNQTRRDRAIQLFDIRDEATYQALESARMVASTDDTRQLSALAIADADADIVRSAASPVTARKRPDQSGAFA